jgi:hypothetical protein
MRGMFFLYCILIGFTAAAQRKTGTVSGLVTDDNGSAIAKATITILGRNTGVLASDSGTFSIKVPAEKSIALVFSHTGFAEKQLVVYLNANEEERITVSLDRTGKTLETVVIGDQRERIDASITRINPKSALALPSTIGGVEGLIKILVGSHNELTSQYSVRGGNYDENLIYVNDFEIYRPYLVRSGQQEGLSFINPEMARNVTFYNGGFQARYGDRMSSVLDIQYKKPRKLAGSAYISLLEQGFHLEGAAKKERVTWLLGARTRSNQNLLSSQETKGAYIPTSADVQAYITYKLNEQWTLEMLTNFSSTKFTLLPESAKRTTSVFSPLFTQNLGLDIFFEGQERDGYTTQFAGLSAVYLPHKKMRLKWMLSRFRNSENENFDIAGAYLFGDRDFDNSSANFGEIVNPLGAGYYQNYGRNQLNITVWNASLKGNIDKGKHAIQFGSSIEQTQINDQLYEWEYQDSAGYSLPVNTGRLNSFLNSKANLSIQKYSGYIQDNVNLGDSLRLLTLQYGIRFNHNSLNGETIISPRAQVAYKPNWQRDVVLKLATGIYNQPPFYRELRRYDGTINTAAKSQKSFQVVAGMDYNFKNKANPFRITLEAYYKQMWDVIPYDIDNVRIRYFGSNNAKAYAIGLETRLYAELLKDAESWLSIGIMRTREDIEGDHYYQYKNAAGEIITSQSEDKIPTDSIRNDVGWLRRPTDRLITVGLFLQDYLSTNKNFKVHLNMLYGSNMPFNIPNSVRWRNALIIDPYIRVDVGFSALLLGEKNTRRSHSPFRNFENIWASFEVFNLIDRPNTIAYQLIKDFSNTVYSIPNRLTPRLLNLKLVARF